MFKTTRNTDDLLEHMIISDTDLKGQRTRLTTQCQKVNTADWTEATRFEETCKMFSGDQLPLYNKKTNYRILSTSHKQIRIQHRDVVLRRLNVCIFIDLTWRACPTAIAMPLVERHLVVKYEQYIVCRSLAGHQRVLTIVGLFVNVAIESVSNNYMLHRSQVGLAGRYHCRRTL